MILDDVVRLHSIQGVLGIPYHTKTIICPLPQHHHSNFSPSFSILWKEGKQYFKCHGTCQLHGDVLDLVGYMKIPGYDRKSTKDRMEAAEILQGEKIELDIPQEPPKKTSLAPWAWKEFTPPGPEVIKYAHSRGLTDETIERFHFGQYKQYAMTMPVFHHGELQAIKMRSLHPKTSKLRYWAMEGSKGALFNFDDVYLTTEPVFIVKGEIAAAYVSQLGFYACAPTGGEGMHVHEYLVALSLARKIVVGDNDKDPKTRKDTSEFARQRAVLFDAILKFPPEEFKDIDEWLLARPEDVSVLNRWIEETK